MYAIISDSGKQFKVATGQTVEVEKKKNAIGEEIVFTDVVAISGDNGVKFGTPNIPGAKVIGQVEGAARGPKVITRKYRHRKGFDNRKGHVQKYTVVRIKEIIVS